MKSLKRSLVFLMVFAMVLSTVAPVFAATPTDVVGTVSEDAVGKLVTLGIIAGYEDGTFQPEKNITRAEFAKIACYVVGMQSAAELSKGATKFKDVGADHWAAGYINIASEKGMVQGIGNNKFSPDTNVTYAQAITILVRALGMGPVVEGKGTWPANYLSKASEAGITSGVAGVVGDAGALRGVIAQLSWNTLEAEKWGEKEYTSTGIVYGPLGKALIEDQYSDYVYKNADGKYVTKTFDDVDVTGTQLAGGLDSDQIQITTDNADLKTLLGLTAAPYTKTVDVTESGIDLNSLYGKKVNLLFGKDNKVAYIKVSSTDVVEGNVSEFKKAEDKITVNDKDYTFATGANIYVNTKNYVYSNANFDAIADAVGDSAAKVTLVLDSGKIKSMNMFVADAITLTGVTIKQFVVKEVKTTGEVTNVAVSSSTQFDLDDVTTDTEKAVFIKNGKKATKDDIKVGDAVTYIKNDTLYYVVITDNKVTGTVTKVASDDNGVSSSARYKLTVSSKDYAMTHDDKELMTKTGDVDDVIAMASTVNDFYNKEATLTLNAAGEIILVSGSVKGSATMQVGVVTKAIWEGNPDTTGTTDYYIQIVTAAGDKKAFKIKNDDFKGAGTTTLASYSDQTVAAGAIIKGAVVLYDVTADGTIDAKNLYDITGQSLSDSTEDIYVSYVTSPTTIKVKDATKKVTIPAGDFFADSSTIYMNSDIVDTDNPAKIADWGKLVKDDYNTGADAANTLLDNQNFYVQYDNSTKIIKNIVVKLNTTIAAETLLGSTAKYGVYVETTSTTDDTFIKLYVDGAEVTYTVANGVYNQTVSNSVYYVQAGDLVRFDINGEGNFDGGALFADKKANFIADKSKISDDELNVDKIKSVNATSKLVTFEAAADRDGETSLTSVVLAADVKIYDVRTSTVKMGALSDLSAGQFVRVTDYDDTDDTFGVVVICE